MIPLLFKTLHNKLVFLREHEDMVNLETWETTNCLTPIKSSIREILVGQKTYFGLEILNIVLRLWGSTMVE